MRHEESECLCGVCIPPGGCVAHTDVVTVLSVASISVCVMQAGVTCTSFLLTTQLESGDWRKRTTTWRPNSWPMLKHGVSVSNQCGHDLLSPITVDTVTGGHTATT